MKWLKAARLWLQSNIKGGDRFIWGSNSVIHMTMAQFEELANVVASTFTNVPKPIQNFSIHQDYMVKLMSTANQIAILQDRYILDDDPEWLAQAVLKVDETIDLLESYRASVEALRLQIHERGQPVTE